MEETFHWYTIYGTTYPEDFIFYIHFTYIGMKREVEEREIDLHRMHYIGTFTRREIEDVITGVPQHTITRKTKFPG